MKFDVTRQRENISWDLMGGVFVKDAAFSKFWPGRTSYTTTGPTGTDVDDANDQIAGDNTDNDNTPLNDHVYSIDGPGRGNDGVFGQFVDHWNFLEFVRIRFDNTTPSTTDTEGSRCSSKIAWHARIWAERNMAGTAYQPRAGKPNDVAVGHIAISATAPTP